MYVMLHLMYLPYVGNWELGHKCCYYFLMLLLFLMYSLYP